MKKIPWFLFIFALFNIGSAYILFSPEKRQWIHSRVVSNNQEVLSVVEGDLINNGSSIKVIKLKTPTSIILEFYSNIQYGSRYLISRVEIPNVRNGFFNHRGQAVQLAIVDLDGDGTMELLSPTFNNKMVAQLNPYSYSQDEKSFKSFKLLDLN